MNVIGRKITSLEVAEMVGKRHDNVMRDIKLIIEQLNTDLKIEVSKLFELSSYKDPTGRELKMYLLNEQACHIFGNRMTGEKGTLFSYKYTTRFKEMENELLKEQFNVPLNYKDALLQLVEKLDEIEELELTIEEQKPKVAFAESLLSSETNILIRNFVKILRNKGINTGEKRLFEYLRSNGYLLKNNYPSQRSNERDWFSVVARTITNDKGTTTKYTTMLTPKGQEYFLNKLLKDGI